MTDPILSTVLSSAAKAVTSIAIQSSKPAWKRATQAAIFEPKAVRTLPEWQEIKANRQIVKKLEVYLNSRQAIGTLEAYAIQFASLMQEPTDDRHFTLFSTGLARALKVDQAKSEDYARQCWMRATRAVRLAVEELRRNDASPVENQILFAKLTSRPNDAQSPLDINLENRFAVNLDVPRATRAANAAQRIKNSSVTYFSEMLMPHAKQGYRIDSDALYISRELSELPIDWQQKSNIEVISTRSAG